MIDMQKNPKERKDNIEVILRPMDDKKPKNASSFIDPDIFTGKNKLHIVRSSRNLNWRFKYERGELPDALKQYFTTFTDAIQYAKNYFGKRNIKIVDIID